MEQLLEGKECGEASNNPAKSYDRVAHSLNARRNHLEECTAQQQAPPVENARKKFL